MTVFNTLRLFIGLSFLFLNGNSQTAINFTNTDSKISLSGAQLYTYDDISNNLRIQDVVDSSSLFNVFNGFFPTYFMSHNWHWVKFELINNSSSPLLLEVDNVTIEKIETYLVSDNKEVLKLDDVNWSVNPNNRKLHTWRNVLRLPITKEEKYTVYVRTYKHYGTLKIPLIIWSERAYIDSEKMHYAEMSFFVGLASILCFLCLLVYVNTKDKKYLLYTLYVFSVFLWRAYIEGYFIETIFSTFPKYANPVYGNILIVFVAMFLLSFLKEFLLKKEKSSKFHYGIYKLMMLYLSSFLVFYIIYGIDVFSFKWYGNMYLIAIFSCVCITILYAIAGIKRKELSAYIYLISCVPLLINTVSVIGSNSTLLPSTWRVDYSVFDALIFEIIILCIGLAIEFKNFVLEKKTLLDTLHEQQKEMYITQNNLSLEALKSEKLKQDLFIEKERISRDLHDNIGSELVNISYSLEYLEQTATTADDKTKYQIKYLQGFVKASILQLRNSLWVLNQETVLLEVFITRLKNYLSKQLDNKSNLNYEVKTSDTVLKQTLSAKTTLHLFRITQELVTNTIKHASADSITISFYEFQNRMLFIYEDNGVGIDVNKIASSESYGIKNIQKRVQEMSGIFEMCDPEGKGVKFKIIF